MEMWLSDDAVAMESRLESGHHSDWLKKQKLLTSKSGKVTSKITVDVLPPIVVAQRCNLQKRFGILSIDAEGVSDKVLHAWVDAGFRPEYVIQETLHNNNF